MWSGIWAIVVVAGVVSAFGCANEAGHPAGPVFPLPERYAATAADGTVLCPTPLAIDPDKHLSSLDYYEFVFFNGVIYRGPGGFDQRPGQFVDASRLGPEYGRVAVSLSRTPPGRQQGLRSCDASYQAVGTAFHEVEGHDRRFLLAREDGAVYVAEEAMDATTAGELLLIRGSVETIAVAWDVGGGAKIEDGFQVEQVLDALLRSPIEDVPVSPPAGDIVSLTFTLADGLKIERSYSNLGGNFHGQIVPSLEFETLLEAITGGPGRR